MKYLLFLIFNVFLHIDIKSQVEWAPPESVWTYDLQDYFTTPAHLGFFKLYNPHDTVIDNEVAITFDYEIGSENSSNDVFDTYDYLPPIIKQEGSRIYRYIRDSFFILYDFDSDIGDTLKIAIPNPNVTSDYYAYLEIDKKEVIQLGTQQLRRLHLIPIDLGLYSYALTFSGWHYEGIGSDFYFNPADPLNCDHFCITRLRCYTDSKKKLRLVDYDCEDIILGTYDQPIFGGQVSIFPNPILTNEEIILRAEDIELSDDTLLQVFNLSGHLIEEKDLVFHDKVTNTGITISEEGVYFLKLSSRNKTIVKKLVVGK